MHFKNVLSCFDGISCGQLALVRAGHTYDNYYASEVDKYAIQITQKHFPQTIQIGDIKSVWSRNLPQIDLIMGGSPCQDLSIAGKRAGLSGERSGLFWHFVRLVRTCKPKYFLLENVASMTKENRDIISKALGVEPILINSALVSAQQRKRLYWTNIPCITQPQDRNIFWDNILINNVEEKYFFSDKTYKGMQKIKERSDARGLGFRIEPIRGKVKFKGLDANYHKGCDGKRSMVSSNNKIRMATPIECERLQTLPDNYTEGVSNTQRYKAIGNGWTVDVIAHIFSFIKE